MKNALISALALVFLLAILAGSVSAFNYYENYTLNLSKVNYFDDFNRSDGNATGSNMTYGGATWFFGGEILNGTMQLDDNYTNYGASIMNPDIYYNTTQVLEFDWNRVEFLNYGSTLDLILGQNISSPTAYFELYFLHESNGTDGSIVCDTNATTYYENTWYHLKIVIDKENHLISVYNDGSPVCENVSFTESAGDTDFWALFATTDSYESVTQFDNIVNYNGTESPYFQTELCYQESTNISTLCGGKSTGSYAYDAGWEGNNVGTGEDIIDGNWSTGARLWINVSNAFLYINYTKPTRALSADWQWQDGCTGLFNLSVPEQCFNASGTLEFYLSADQNSQNYWCNNGTDWVWLMNCTNWAVNRYEYEEGLWWDMLPCTPDWTCTGYDSCLTNDTQNCNAVTDLNSCGNDYMGDYSEFTPQVCDYCTPDEICDTWGVCQLNNTQPCVSVTDNNGCYAITGLPADIPTNPAEWTPQACVYCVPDWNCNGWGTCTNGSQPCNSVSDLNLCGASYEGNYSEFTPQNCSTPLYTPSYVTGDLTGLTFDTLGSGLIAVLSLIGVIVLVNIIIWGLNRFKGGLR